MKKFIVPLGIFLMFVLGIIIYINRFTIFGTIDINGFALNSNVIVKNLNDGVTKKSKKITYEKVKVNDTLYVSRKKFYIGDRRKKSISMDFPIISKDSSTVLILNDVGKYVDESFIKTDTYANTIITDSHLFSAINNEQVDEYEYYFIELNNGLYENTSELEIEHNEKIIIPTNSFVLFQKEYLRYYYLENDKFIYKDIPVMDLYDEVKIGKFDGTYNELLTNLGVIGEEKIEEIIDEEEDNNLEESEIEIGDDSEEYPVEIHEGTSIEKEKRDYIEPTIILKNEKMDTYSFKGQLIIQDPSNVLVKNPTFDIMLKGSSFVRKTVSSGDFIIFGLLPSTEYEVIGTYIYKNESDNKVNRQFFKKTLSTKDNSALGNLILEKDFVASDYNYVLLEGLHLSDKANEELLRGIGTVYVEIGDYSFQLNSKEVSKLARLEKIDYQTPSVLNSNTVYNAEIKIYDVAKDLIKTVDNKFIVKTTKSPPSGTVEATTSKNFKSVSLKIDIKNVDNIIVDNYRYVVYEEDVFLKELEISENTKHSEVSGLDTGKKYTIILLCDYYKENGERINNFEIASTEFNTYDVQKHESIPFIIQEAILENETASITSSSASFNITYSNYSADDFIYNLLDDDMEVDIVDNETGDIKDHFVINKYQFTGLGYTFKVENLDSNTKYKIMIKPTVTSGNKVISIRTTYNKNIFNTLKLEPSFEVLNLYIASGYIDFDAVIYDKDSAIQENTVTLNVYNEDEERVYMKELETSRGVINDSNPMIKNRITLSGLSSSNTPNGDNYIFKVVAENYDNGSAKISNKEVQDERNYNLSGTYGEITINKLLETPYYYASVGSSEGKNLFNIKNTHRWKSVGTNSNSDLMTIKREDNSIELSAKNGYRLYSYYLPELVGKSVAISFKARKTLGSQTNICVVNGVSVTNPACKNDFLLESISSNYTTYSTVFSSLDSSGYISFYVHEVNNANEITTLELLDLQIEEGTESSSTYRKFEDTDEYVGLFNVRVNTAYGEDGVTELAHYVNRNVKDNINSGNYEYFVRFQCDGENCPSKEEKIYKLDDNKLPIEQVMDIYSLAKDANYKGLLSVYDSEIDRYYDISNSSFVSDNETRTINSVDDFFKMHSTGYYAINADLDLRNVNKTYSGVFQGSIDFQGYKLILGPSNNKIFGTFGGSAILKNADIHYYLKTDSGNALGSYYGLFNVNYGTLSNVKMTLESINNAPNAGVSLIAWQNYGTIENFVFHAKVPFIGSHTLSFGPSGNYGTIKNGYAYGSSIQATYANTGTGSKNVGVFAASSTTGSTLKNVYSLIDVEIGDNPTDKDYIVGNLIGTATNSKINNSLVVASAGLTKRKTTSDVSVGNVSGNINSKELYYISNINYSDAYTNKIADKSLNNPKFLSNLLNDEKKFLTDEAWKNKAMPQLDWPSCMPSQDYLALVDLASEQTVKLISVDSIKYLNPDDNNGYIAEIEMSLYNKNNARIEGMEIEGFDIDDIYIVNPNTKVNSDKIQILIIQLKEPTHYISSYKLKKIMIPSGTIDVNTNIDIDLYRKISSLGEIKTYISAGDSNFQLTRDINCNDDGEVCDVAPIATITGKFDGAGHMIENLTSKGCFINELKGILKNIHFKNYTINESARDSGLICSVTGNGIVDGVSIENELIHAGKNSSNISYIGGITAFLNNGTIRNSSVLVVEIDDNKLSSSTVNAGGIAGVVTNSTITNSFARRISYNLTVNNSDGIGGIVGKINSGNVSNVYATGRIDTTGGYVGGIVGRNSGRVNSAIAKVELISTQDHIGGIAGENPTNTNSLTKTLSLGDISTSKENPTNFDRTAGDRIENNANFAWDKQKKNSKISSNSNGDILLTEEELANSVIYSSRIGISQAFSLNENFRPGYIPAICSLEGNLLLNQGYENSSDSLDDLEIKYEEDFKLIDISSTIVYSSGHNDDPLYATKANLSVRLSNLKRHEIQSLEIDGVQISGFGVRTDENNISELLFTITPNNYYDSYVISKIHYFDYEEGVEKDFNTMIKLEIPFYGQIRSVSDWQNIEKGTLENYIVLNDLSFNGVSNLKYGLSFNSLIGAKEDGNVVIGNMNMNSPLSMNVGEGLIDTISARISKIDFKNISLKTTKSGNYFGLIKFLTGEMQNVNFDNIRIDTSSKASYVGLISFNQSQSIRDIKISNLTVNGKQYVGGFIGKSEAYDKTNIDLNNVTVTANGHYAGGLLAYENWDVQTTHTFNVRANNVTVTNSKTAYRNTGGVFGYGSGNVIYFINGTVTGFEYVGGISGQESNRNLSYNYVYDSTIHGYGAYIGGAVGANQNLQYAYVKNTTIDGHNTANYVGGISGYGGWTVYYSGISDDSKIINANNYVGAIKGTISWGTIHNTYAKDVEVHGHNYVGGIAGSTTSRSNTLYNNVTNAYVEGIGGKAGGIIGYIPNLNTTTADNITRIYRNIVAGAMVVGGTNVGGMIGDMQNELFSGHFYQNVIVSDVICRNSSCVGGYVIGWEGTDAAASKMTGWGIYEGSTFNNVKVKSSQIPSTGKIITKANLAKLSSYTGFNKNDFEEVANHFPRQKRSENSERGDFRVTFDIPVSKGSNYIVQSTSGFSLLPDVSAYAVDVNKINIEFSNVYEGIKFVINNKEYNLTEKTYTFYYDFKDDISILITNGISEKTVVLYQEDLKNAASIYNGNYYFIDENNHLESNSNVKIDMDDSSLNLRIAEELLVAKFDSSNIQNANNIYQSKILLDDHMIYDLEKDTVITVPFENLTLVQTEPLYTFEYGNQIIKTFDNYSTVDDEVTNKIIFIVNNQVEFVNQSIQASSDQILVDNYNGDYYLVYLNKKGKLVSLKDQIRYPNGFKNYNISSITTSEDKNDKILFVEYNDGDYIAFNYITGDIIGTKSDHIPSLWDYINEYVTMTFDNQKKSIVSKQYENSKSMVSKLKATPIEKVLDDEKTNQYYINSNYSIMYNPSNNHYDIYEIPINSSSKTMKSLKSIVEEESVTSQINNNEKLIKFYGKPEVQSFRSISSLFIITFILVAIALTTIVLKTYFQKNKKRKS